MSQGTRLPNPTQAALRAAFDPVFFVENYVQIESAEAHGWIPFHLWDAQRAALRQMQSEQRLIILKARQLGLTWLALAHALWKMLFEPPATVLLFSLRENEARELLRRLRAMYGHLPATLRDSRERVASANQWALANDSRAIAFSTNGGRSYTGTLAIVDEADFVPRLGDFLNAVKPTVDGGGQLMLISTADKSRPLSTFKRIFRAAHPGNVAPDVSQSAQTHPSSADTYCAIFLPWHARADRTQAWYARVAAEMRAQRGSDDDLFQEYPATVEEALRVRSLSARIPAEAVARITRPLPPQPLDNMPALPAILHQPHWLRVFAAPTAAGVYALGADPAEGNPRRDESAATVLDTQSGAQVAVLAGALEPEPFALACAALAAWYNDAPLLVERNNHGHTVLATLRAEPVQILRGLDGKPGWLTTAPSKALLYNALAQAVREEAIALCDEETSTQLASIDALTLRAPDAMHDDRAMALALALRASEHAHYLVTPPIAPMDDPCAP